MRGAVPRALSRQAALQVLYAVDRPCHEAAAEVDVSGSFEAVAENFELPGAARAFAAELVEGVMGRRDELDALIGEHARNWRLSRLSLIHI